MIQKMHLEKLEIQGFKSFATKNMLVFPNPEGQRRGITTIVGPNGSGKSNIADAVRWALGEQSMKSLRGKKSEDIIFSGSDKKGKLGMAEVSLYLNNQDKQAPIDFDEVVITRRLYRSGESEYLLNNSKVRLYDLQILLAKANFGQKTYSVIGQGTVEGFLNTSMAERKEFFDEATGVRQYQIKRDEALNKLKLSYENLGQAKLLLSEIEPRLKSLTKQVNKLKRRNEIELELEEMQLNYYSKLWHDIEGKFSVLNKELLDVENIKIEKERLLENLNADHHKFENGNSAGSEYIKLQETVRALQAKKDGLVRRIAVIDAESKIQLEREGKFDLAWLNQRMGELKEQIAEKEKALSEQESSHKAIGELHGQSSQKLIRINESIKELNRNISTSKSFLTPDDIKVINAHIRESLQRIKYLQEENDMEAIKVAVIEISEYLEKVYEISGKLEDKESIEDLQGRLMQYIEEREEHSKTLNKHALDQNISREKQKMIRQDIERLTIEQKEIIQKLESRSDEKSKGDLSAEKKELEKELVGLEKEMGSVNKEVGELNQKEEESRRRLFDLQKSIQSAQADVNQLINRYNELKVRAARHETRLEDLENDIRQNFKNIKKVKEHIVEGDVDFDIALEKIKHLKKQLELIGGIDPEIEKEYIETKEKFDFLSEQANDLSGAIDSLEKVVKELDATIKERFDAEFKVIAKKFEEYFKVLFNGGTAKLIKVMESDLEKEKEEEAPKEEEPQESEAKAPKGLAQAFDTKKIKMLQKHNATGLAGIEIQATPPGKKIKTLAMLSGGERALTAIAMICAIISSNPSPFVVLDEVDAALDEANSERLAQILDDLSNKTQFIVISHNRASMRKAQILYGVTMQDDGVSKLLSVKLEEAKEYSK